MFDDGRIWSYSHKKFLKPFTRKDGYQQVGAYKNYELVMTFPSASEASRNGFDQSNVSDCCNGKLPHYKGYTWRYL